MLAAGPGRAEVPAALQPAACPVGAPTGLACWRGQDAEGAHLLLARPAEWNGRLVTHVFGGPRLAPPGPDYTDGDLLNFGEFLQQGGGGDQRADAQAGEPQPFGEGERDDGMLRRLQQRRVMAIGEVAIGAVMHQQRAHLARDGGEGRDLVARVADA